jgi:hypothetical protein
VTELQAGSVAFSQCEDVQLQLAQTEWHYRGAFELVHDAYTRAGLDEPNECGLRVTPYQLLDTSQVFVSTLNGVVISTLTLVQDGQLGLPMEAIYTKEIQDRRERGVNLAEVTCLADRRLSPKRFFALFCDLSRVMAQFAQRQGVDEIWIACHPTHASLYERRLAFERQGDLCDYPAVLGNPAVPLRVDLTNLAEAYPKVWQRFFGEPIAHEVLAPSALSRDLREYYAEFAGTCVPNLGRAIVEMLEVA